MALIRSQPFDDFLNVGVSRRKRHITSACSVEYLDVLLKEIAKACESAGNKGREFLNLAMKDAVMEGRININPISETKLYRRKKPKITILSKDKIKMLLEAASKDNWYLEILLGLFCGLRKGEILGLKFSDFDLEKQTVHIHRQVVANCRK